MRNETAAFDLWIRRDLSKQFSAVMQEQLPQDLLDLLDGAEQH